jgi:hypothetical protein
VSSGCARARPPRRVQTYVDPSQKKLVMHVHTEGAARERAPVVVPTPAPPRERNATLHRVASGLGLPITSTSAQSTAPKAEAQSE